ncbi:S1C family serine protease, partial [Streptococcus pyogenes]
MKKYLKFTILFLVGFLGGVTGSLVIPFVQQMTTPVTQTNTKSEKTSVSNVTYKNETSVTNAVKTVEDAVVSVINYQPEAGGQGSIFGNENPSD